jgi:hypothetical protein
VKGWQVGLLIVGCYAASCFGAAVGAFVAADPGVQERMRSARRPVLKSVPKDPA